MKNRTSLIATSLILLSPVIGILMLYEGHNWGGDFAQYIIQSEYILGKNDRDIEGLLSSGKLPFTYPWGYPLVLGITSMLFGDSIIIYKYINIILLFISNTIFYLSFKNDVNNKLVLLSLLFFNAYLLFFTNNIISEITYYFFSLIFISVIQNLCHGKTFKITLLILAIITLSGAIITRTNGYFLFIYLFATSIDKKGVYYKLGIAVFSVLIVVLSQQIFPVSKGSIINTLLSTNLQTVINNIKSYILLIPNILYFENSIIEYKIKNILILIYLFPLLYLNKKVLKKYKGLLMYMIANIILYSVWPGHPDLRFILPLFPIIFLLITSGIDRMSSEAPKATTYFKNFIVAYTICVSISLSVFIQTLEIRKDVNIIDKNITYENLLGPYSESSKDLFYYMSNNIYDEAIVYFQHNSRLVYFKTGLSSVSDISDSKVTHYILDKDEYLNNSLNAIMIYSNRDYVVLKKQFQ